ncbi:MAG TPA: tyrosine-type recombinase/integrase [Terriglobales bacterium]|nr:tyrosine-type recombinase/integrase [Terriglobales bacterium]
MSYDPEFASRTFREAAAIWLESRRPHLKARTLSDYKEYLVPLNGFFGDMRLRAIHAAHLREYQHARLEGVPPFKQKAGASRINHELSMLGQILRRGGLWAAVEPGYEPLRLPKFQPPRALTAEQEQRLFAVASGRPEWAEAYYAGLLMVNTTASGCEVRGLRIADVDLVNRTISVREESAKNQFRVRRIPLNGVATLAVEKLLERAASLGAREPQHYVFPYREARNRYDPTRPMSRWGLRGAFREIKEAAGLPSFRPHDLRHTSITRMAEAGVPVQVGMSISGHNTRQMWEWYSQIGMEAKRNALGCLEAGPPKVYGMNGEPPPTAADKKPRDVPAKAPGTWVVPAATD